MRLIERPGQMQKTTGTMHSLNGLYATPLSWPMEYITVSYEDKPIEETRLKKQARIIDGGIYLTACRKTYEKLVGPPLAGSCSLSDMLQRLRTDRNELSFTPLHRLGLTKEDQQIVRSGTRKASPWRKNIRTGWDTAQRTRLLPPRTNIRALRARRSEPASC